MVVPREKNLCYNGHDKFVPGLNCKKQILFLLDQEELEEEDIDIDEIEEKEVANEQPGA